MHFSACSIVMPWDMRPSALSEWEEWMRQEECVRSHVSSRDVLVGTEVFFKTEKNGSNDKLAYLRVNRVCVCVCLPVSTQGWLPLVARCATSKTTPNKFRWLKLGRLRHDTCTCTSWEIARPEPRHTSLLIVMQSQGIWTTILCSVRQQRPSEWTHEMRRTNEWMEWMNEPATTTNALWDGSHEELFHNANEFDSI